MIAILVNFDEKETSSIPVAVSFTATLDDLMNILYGCREASEVSELDEIIITDGKEVKVFRLW
jgi:hypothetical protein